MQTRQVLSNIQTVLVASGGAMADIVKVTVFVTDVSHSERIHEVRATFFGRRTRRARSFRWPSSSTRSG